MALPGGVSAEATALVDIGVVRERRGRGYARALITAFLNQAHARGEALAALNTDLLGLYERFGFGVATTSWSATLGARSEAPAKRLARGEVHLIEAGVAATVLPQIFAASHHHRVGEVLRTASWWEEHLADAARARFPTQFAILEQDGERQGYVAFVHPAQRSGPVVVAELVVGADEQAGQLLDFVRTTFAGDQVRLRSEPADVIATLDGLEVVHDSSPQLWLRILDVARALSLRSYAAPSSIVLAISDDLLEANRGRFLLQTSEDGSSTICLTEKEPVVRLDVGALARVFLGGSTFAELAERGEVEVADDAAIASLDQAFEVPRAPFCSTLL